jgi:Domain of unknown function DUF29
MSGNRSEDEAELAPAGSSSGAEYHREAIARAYRKARLQQANETGIDEDRFPHSCPYTWVEIVSREFSSSER